jgi:hypothetical protein
MDLNGFNALEIEPATSYEPLPADWYKAVITQTEEKANEVTDWFIPPAYD